jgi:hypothetical protein
MGVPSKVLRDPSAKADAPQAVLQAPNKPATPAPGMRLDLKLLVTQNTR